MKIGEVPVNPGENLKISKFKTKGRYEGSLRRCATKGRCEVALRRAAAKVRCEGSQPMEYSPWRGALRYARTGDQVAFMVGLKGGDKKEIGGVVVSVDDSKEDVDKSKTCMIDCNGRQFMRRLCNIRIIFQ